jgi:hypothetical protein
MYLKKNCFEKRRNADRVIHLKNKWSTFSHNGVAFPQPYEPRHFSIRIRGKSLELSPLQEEMLWALAKKKDTPYINDIVFVKNFVNDLKGTAESTAIPTLNNRP